MTTFLRVGFHLFALSVTIFLAVDLFYAAVQERLRTGYRGKAQASFSTEVDSPRKPKLDEYRVIMDRNVFGASEEEEEEKQEEPEPLEPTSLDVALLGTVAGDTESAVAVIRDTAKKAEAFYRVGDDVQGAVVKKIRRGEVILRAGGRDEVLKMADVDRPQGAAGDRPGPAVQPPPSRGPGPSRQSETSLTIDRTEVEQKLRNINEMFSQARIRPYFVDGKPGGLAITSVKSGSIFSSMGLRNGDVIQGLDGREIKAPNDALALFRKLRSGEPFSLELSRRGSPAVIRYGFE